MITARQLTVIMKVLGISLDETFHTVEGQSLR
jgi:hypothetical protein